MAESSPISVHTSTMDCLCPKRSVKILPGTAANYASGLAKEFRLGADFMPRTVGPDLLA